MWTVDSEDADGIVGRYDSVCVAILRSPIDSRFLDRLGDSLAAAREAHPDGFSAIVVRASEAPGSMSAPLREKARTILGGNEGRLRGFAYVLGGTGLRARVVRGAMNAVLLGASFPGKIFSRSDEAVRWITSLPTQPSDVRGAERDILSTLEGLV